MIHPYESYRLDSAIEVVKRSNHNRKKGEKIGTVTCRAHPKCTYGYEYHSKVHKLERISFHVYYHSELEKDRIKRHTGFE